MRYAIVANGFAEGPAQALRDYLVARDADVVAISHPLTPEQGSGHVISRFVHGHLADTRTRRLPLRPPLSFALDPFVPLVPPRVDAWFGFNPLAAARGLVARGQRRTRSVVLWSVDFVPDRFGRGTLPTRIYDRLDKLCCTRADARIELSGAARDGRNARHRLDGISAPTHVVPMGAWLEHTATTTPDGVERRNVVFLGHLVERQGVDVFLDALAILKSRGERMSAAVIGGGPLERELRQRAETLGLGDIVRFHGFVPDHRAVEQLLADSSVAVAPYRPDESSFTRYADPGKLKAYAAAGLPMVLTDVPPNAHELEREAGAEVVPYDAGAIAEAISRALVSPERWRGRRTAALGYARRFDWEALLGELLRKLELEPGAR
jgi:glycosyltransferase involved in cell wall biosynthesis